MSIAMDIIDQLTEQNRQWVDQMNEADPEFFERTAKEQRPKVLWIGCSDSRVPESVILKCLPSDIFVHRNIANQVFPHDTSAISVITFALRALKVEHIIVAGHSNCGGVAVCIDKDLTEEERQLCFLPGERSSWPPPPPMDEWLQELRDHAQSLRPAPTVLELVKENVHRQVETLLSLPVVQSAWAQPGQPNDLGNLKGVHGWLYELNTGYVQDISVSVYSANRVPAQ